MRFRWWLIALLAVAVLAGACGDNGEHASDIHTADELDAVVLGTGDLGEGWAEQRREVFTTRDEGPPSFNASSLCPAASEEVEALEALAADSGAIVELRQEGLARHDFHGVTEQLWGGADAAEYFSTVRTALEKCVDTTWTVEEDQGGEGGPITLKALETPSVGDESTAAVAEVLTPGPDGSYLWRSRILVARFGTTLMTLDELDVQLEGSAPHFTDADWADLVATAAARVEPMGAG